MHITRHFKSFILNNNTLSVFVLMLTLLILYVTKMVKVTRYGSTISSSHEYW